MDALHTALERGITTGALLYVTGGTCVGYCRLIGPQWLRNRCIMSSPDGAVRCATSLNWVVFAFVEYVRKKQLAPHGAARAVVLARM